MSLLLIRIGVGVAIAVGGVLAVWLGMRGRNQSFQYSASEPVSPTPTCCICLKELNDKWKTVTLDCKHVLHQKCAELLFTQAVNKCPLCRTIVSNNFIKKNF